MLLLDAIAQVETGNTVAVGDHGAAISKYQIHRAVWQDVKLRFGDPRNPERGKPYLDVGAKWEDIGGADTTSQLRARACANAQIVIIEEYLLRHGAACTAENIYACWNLGREGFKRRAFHLDQCPPRTIRAAMEVARLAATKKEK